MGGKNTSLPRRLASLLIWSILRLPLQAEARTFRVWSTWFKHAIENACVVDIEGADLQHRSNRFIDKWGFLPFPFSSKPDPFVEVKHGGTVIKSQILGNRLMPRWYYSAIVPYYSKRGFHLTVYDANVLEANKVIGRTWIGPIEAASMIESGEAELLSLGHGIGMIKVKIYRPANLKDRKTPLATKTISDEDHVDVVGYCQQSPGEGGGT